MAEVILILKYVGYHKFVFACSMSLFGCSSPAFAGGNARLLVLGYNQSLYIRNDLLHSGFAIKQRIHLSEQFFT